jgi:hypothetical protein
MPFISGRAHDIKNRALTGVILTVTGDTTILQNIDGDYCVDGLRRGNYLITPLKAGTKFFPQNFTVYQFDRSLSGIDFLGCISISGRICDTMKQPKPGIEVLLSGEKNSNIKTDKDGYYFFDSLCYGKYIIMPNSHTHEFDPDMILLQDLKRQIDLQNFNCKDKSSTGIKDNMLPVKTSAANNFPNPFNSSTNIAFSLDKRATVSLSVYDILGRLIAELLKNETLEANNYKIKWDVSRFNSCSGIYFYILKVETGNALKSFTGKMLLLK